MFAGLPLLPSRQGGFPIGRPLLFAFHKAMREGELGKDFTGCLPLKREPNRDMQGAIRIPRTGIEVVPIFQADGANRGPQSQSDPDGMEVFVIRNTFLFHALGETIPETDNGKVAEEPLFQLDIGQGIGLRADQLTLRGAG